LYLSVEFGERKLRPVGSINSSKSIIRVHAKKMKKAVCDPKEIAGFLKNLFPTLIAVGIEQFVELFFDIAELLFPLFVIRIG